MSTRARIGCIEALRSVVGDRLTTGTSNLSLHSKGEGHVPPSTPDAVIWPRSTEEVSELMKICSKHVMPVIPFGVGTSLEGHVNPIHGGISLDMSQMDGILEVNDEDLDCLVQAGVTRKALNTDLRSTGLFFPVDPGADATIGGMCATRASGTTTVRYGAMKENVVGLTAVMPDGKIVKTGGRSRKSAAGYDLTRLLLGSEGTLGVITEARLRLHGIPATIASAVCPFETIEGAVKSVIPIIQLGIPVARLELLDEQFMDLINKHLGTAYPVKPTLFIEFHGASDVIVAEQVELVKEISNENGGVGFEWTNTEQERNKLWHARHNAYISALQANPGSNGWPTDVAVPISRLVECILAARKDIEEEGVLGPILGHVGDGNFHAIMLYQENDPADVKRVEKVNSQIVNRALMMGGTCTGEHGIGIGKMDFLQAEAGAGSIEVMKAIKKALDPLNIMNPGKLLPGMC